MSKTFANGKLKRTCDFNAKKDLIIPESIVTGLESMCPGWAKWFDRSYSNYKSYVWESDECHSEGSLAMVITSSSLLKIQVFYISPQCRNVGRGTELLNKILSEYPEHKVITTTKSPDMVNWLIHKGFQATSYGPDSKVNLIYIPEL